MNVHRDELRHRRRACEAAAAAGQPQFRQGTMAQKRAAQPLDVGVAEGVVVRQVDALGIASAKRFDRRVDPAIRWPSRQLLPRPFRPWCHRLLIWRRRCYRLLESLNRHELDGLRSAIVSEAFDHRPDGRAHARRWRRVSDRLFEGGPLAGQSSSRLGKVTATLSLAEEALQALGFGLHAILLSCSFTCDLAAFRAAGERGLMRLCIAN